MTIYGYTLSRSCATEQLKLDFSISNFTFTPLASSLVGHPAAAGKLANGPPHPYAATKEGESKTTGTGP